MIASKKIKNAEEEIANITNYLDPDYLAELDNELSRDDAIPESELMLSIDKELQEQLDNDTISPEWVRDNAPWKQQENESNDEYFMFTCFCSLPVTKWNVEDAYVNFATSRDIEYSDKIYNAFLAAYEKHDWITRRSSYIAYSEWVQRKRAEIEQLAAIANFRNNQALMLNRISKAASSLVDKIAKKIELIDPDEISVRDIPSFVSSISNFLNIASDAEARILAVSELLAIYEDELNIGRLREHVYGTNLGIDNVDVELLPNKSDE